MGILRSPATLLIVGILSRTTIYVQGREEQSWTVNGITRTCNTDNGLTAFEECKESFQAEVQGTMDVGIPSSMQGTYSNLDNVISGVFRSIPQMCDTNGDSAALNEFQEGLRIFKDCLDHLLSGLQWYGSTGYLIDDVTYKCSKAEPLKSCVKELANSAFTCLDNEGDETLKNIQNMISSVLKYLCDEHGKRAKTLIMEPACFFEHSDSGKPTLTTCYTDFLQTDKLQMLQSFITGSLAMDYEKCEYFDKFDRCIIEAIEDCTNPTTADTAKSIRHILIEESGCGKFIESQASPSIGAVHSLLLIAAIAMFFRLR